MDELPIEFYEDMARKWYNEQRGYVMGNTRAWDDLDQLEKVRIITRVMRVHTVMKKTWNSWV